MTIKTMPCVAKMAGSPRQNEMIPQRILVVDDEPLIRLINTDILLDAGFQVDAAEDGAAAWDVLQRNDYDLLVTDNQMPKIWGVELVEKIRVAGMGLPILMATATLPDETFTGGGWLQPFALLLKPYSRAELLDTVKTLLGAAHLAGESVTQVPNWGSNSRTLGMQI